MQTINNKIKSKTSIYNKSKDTHKLNKSKI